MDLQPPPFNGELQARAVLCGSALVAEQERTVEFLDVDPAILNWFESVSVLQQATGGLFGVGEGRSAVSFKAEFSRFPVLGEWHGGSGSVMPVRHDIHRTCRATFLADETAADLRTRVSLQAGCPGGHRPCGDRTYRRSIGCCTLYDRPRAIPPGRRVDIYQSIVHVVARPSRMISRPTTGFNYQSLGIGTGASYCASRV